MKRAVYPLYAPADESRVKPILDALKAKGVTVRKDDPRKGDALVLFRSEAVKADSPAVDEFFRLYAGRELVIPVNLDGSTPPEELQNALMARHTLDGRKYSAEELSDLVAKAVKGDKKSLLPLILTLIGSAAFLAVGTILLFQQRTAPPPPAPPATEVPATSTPAPTEPPRVDGIDVDLSQVAEVVFLGDEFHFYTFDEKNTKGKYVNPRRDEDFAYGGWMDDGVHFYSKEDGHEYPHVTLDDLSWLALLPNLRFLSLCNVTATLPDLSGLTDLRDVMVGYSDLSDLEGLRGSTIQNIEYHGAGVSDFSPLTDCQNLRSAHLDLVGSPRADLSGFHPPKLTSLGLGSGFGVEGVDFSFLLQCPNLQELLIDGYPQLTDLSCLANAGKLKKLELRWTDSLRTLTGLEGAPLLEELRIDDLEGLRTLEGLEDHRYLKIVNINDAPLLRDISPLEGCSSLVEFRLSGNGPLEYLTDVSVLGRLPRLQNIALFGANHIGSLDFLKELQIKNNVVLEFCIAGPCDYSGIAAIDTFRYVHANTCGNYAAAAPYLEGKTIRQLMIYNGGLVDLSTLPNVTGELDLCDCLNRDLTGIRELKFSGKLWIQDCPYFTSFDGIENLTGIGKGDSILTVEGCPRLTDWSGIEGKRFDRLELKGVFTLPDLSKITFTSLALEYLEEDVLPDLTCLNGINENRRYNFRFVGMDQITDLSPLFRLKGYTLEVPPQVGEQAKGLVEDKRFTKCEIVYPDGGWDPSDVQVQLLSLDELETLPPSLLKHVKKLTIIGDELVNDDTTNFWSDWGQQNVPAFVEDRATGEQKRIDRPGTRITDFSKLSVLTGLEELVLWWQPLTSLEGVQALENLQRLKVMFSPNLTDVSAAFTLQGLKEINFERCPVASLQGVQNLYDLEMLEVCNTKITSLEGIEGLKHLRQVRVAGTNIRDFSPLGQVDFTYAMTQDWEPGVSLALNVMNSNSLPADAYAFLAGIPGFSQLELHNVPAKLWLDHLAGKPVKRLNADDCGFTNEQFKAFVEAHPELEEVQISWNPQLTDVSCLLNLENLRKVQLSPNMAQAKASLGAGYGFELQVD